MNGKQNFLLIGSYTPPDENGIGEQISKDWYRQGYVYRNDRAFYDAARGKKPQEVCYIPELNNAKYTYGAFLELCEGDAEAAKALYEAVDWVSPGTLLDEWEREGEVDHCPSCGRLFLSYGKKKCPHCGALYHNGD